VNSSSRDLKTKLPTTQTDIHATKYITDLLKHANYWCSLQQ